MVHGWMNKNNKSDSDSYGFNKPSKYVKSKTPYRTQLVIKATKSRIVWNEIIAYYMNNFIYIYYL